MTSTLEEPKVMTRYRLLAGFHVEPNGTDQGRLVKPEEIFESENPWYVDKWPEKFAYADNSHGSTSGYIWNPAQESLEEFTARMHAAQSTKKPVPPAAKSDKPLLQSAMTEVDIIASMTPDELRKYAEEEEIDIKKVKRGGANERNELLKVILDVVQAPAPAAATATK